MQEYEYERRIMGSDSAVSLIAPSQSVADAAYERMIQIAEEYEARFSRFRPESELSRVNAGGIGRMSPEFMTAVMQARELYEKSRGVFNPLSDISRFGYDEDISVVKGAERTGGEASPYSLDFTVMRIDPQEGTLALAPGQKLDFGGFMKGHTAERMAVAARNCSGVIVNLGGDIYTRGRDQHGVPFVFEVDNPFDPATSIPFYATDAAIATSGSYNRHWKLNGRPFSHILDQSGKQNPTSDLISATVIAPKGREADAFATAAIVLGSVEGGRLLDELGLSYCFIRTDGTVVKDSSFASIL